MHAKFVNLIERYERSLALWRQEIGARGLQSPTAIALCDAVMMHEGNLMHRMESEGLHAIQWGWTVYRLREIGDRRWIDSEEIPQAEHFDREETPAGAEIVYL